jgi:hypothetical protein
MNFKFINLTFFLNLLFFLTNTKASIASNLYLSLEETIVLHKTYSSDPLQASKEWERFSFDFLTSLNVHDGDINVYWQDDLPAKPHTENHKYSVGFRYAKNFSVCWNGKDVRNSANITDTVNGFCPDSHPHLVNEPKEVKKIVRPKSYFTLHQDEGFGGIDPIGTGLEFPGNTVDTYRMTLSLLDQNEIGVSTSFLNGNSWEKMSVYALNDTQKNLLGVAKLSSTLPISLAYSPELETIEGIEIQFRKPSTSTNPSTSIKELLVTQTITNNQAISNSIPEGSNLFSLLNVGLIGLGLATRKLFVNKKSNNSLKNGKAQIAKGQRK